MRSTTSYSGPGRPRDYEPLEDDWSPMPASPRRELDDIRMRSGRVLMRHVCVSMPTWAEDAVRAECRRLGVGPTELMSRRLLPWVRSVVESGSLAAVERVEVCEVLEGCGGAVRFNMDQSVLGPFTQMCRAVRSKNPDVASMLRGQIFRLARGYVDAAADARKKGR